MQYIFIYHANLNYAYLPEDKYEFVIRKSYEMILDTMTEYFPKARFVFEASGFTVEQMALKTPDVLQKLKAAIQSGQCEFMGSPYAHPMLPNFPREDGNWSLLFSNEIYERYLNMHPVSFWNPECGWRDFIPHQVLEAGYRNLLGDFEAYSRSRLKNGQPCRPEIFEIERQNGHEFYNFDFEYQLRGDDPAIHFPFKNIDGINHDKLRIFLRSDRIAQFGVRHFMGMPGYSFEKYLQLIKHYSQNKPGLPEGALIIFADDAEYIGTNGWFKLKYENKPDQVFEHTPDSQQKLIRLVNECQKIGEFITFQSACENLPPLEEVINFDNDSAWHGARASTWANTPMAKLLRPWQDKIRDKLKRNGKSDSIITKKIWYHLTNSYNSDGQWPPTLPEAPHIIFPYNYRYCFDNLLTADHLVGGVDRRNLEVDPVATLHEILGPQQELVLSKAELLFSVGSPEEKEKALLATELISKSKNTTSVKECQQKILYPSEYEIRANALIEARKLVGGIILEKENTSFKEIK